MTNLQNIGQFTGIELATFKLNDGVREEAMLELITKIDNDFLQKEEGFLGHTTLKGEDGIYVDILFAKTQEKAQEICGNLMQNETALQYMNLADEPSVSVSFWNRIKMTDLQNIGTFKGMEFATFKLKNGVSEEKMLEIIKKVDEQFLQNEEGFLGHTTLTSENGIYADVAFATTQEKAQEICGKWMENEMALQYVDLIDEPSVNMSFWSRIK